MRLTDAEQRWLDNLRGTEGPNSSTVALIEALQHRAERAEAERDALRGALVELFDALAEKERYVVECGRGKAAADRWNACLDAARNILENKYE